MLQHVINLAQRVGASRIIVIIGHGKERILETLAPRGDNPPPGEPSGPAATGTRPPAGGSTDQRYLSANRRIEWVTQGKQLGTGHAVQQTEPLLRDFTGPLLVLSGDVPLLRLRTVRKLLATHFSRGAGATLLTTHLEDPAGYGRVLRNSDGTLRRIVEEQDCRPVERIIREINGGVYVFDPPTLFKALKLLDNHNYQGEYYLPDTLQYFPRFRKTVALETVADPDEVAGVNTDEQLLKINRIFKYRNADRD